MKDHHCGSFLSIHSPTLPTPFVFCFLPLSLSYCQMAAITYIFSKTCLMPVLSLLLAHGLRLHNLNVHYVAVLLLNYSIVIF